MSRGKVASANNFLAAGALLTAEPCTIAGWCYWTSVTSGYMAGVYYTAGADTNSDGFAVYQTTTTGIIRAYKLIDGASSYSATATGVGATTWTHVGGVFVSATSRFAYIGGTAGTESTTSRVFANTPDKTAIGALYQHNNAAASGATNSYLAEWGFWNVALTAADMLQLATGCSPLMVKPESLVGYFPLIRGDSNGDEPNLITGTKITEVGTVPIQNHPRIYYPGLRYWSVPSAAAGTTYDLISTMEGTSVVTSAGKVKITPTSTAAGTSAVVTAAVVKLPVLSTMTGTSAIVLAGVNAIAPISTMAGTSALTTSGKVTIDVAATSAGTSALVSAGVSLFKPVAMMAGTSALTSAGILALLLIGALTGTSSLIVAGIMTETKTVYIYQRTG
jgi:hypothetical protein